MDQQEELKELILPLLEEEGAELVELKLVRSQGNTLLRLFVDKAGGGITVGECSELNRKIGGILDSVDMLKEGYTLEVSSPGLDRPLKTKSDFLRSRDKTLRFFFNEPVEGKWELEATVREANDESVIIEAKGRVFPVLLSRINRAKHIIIG